MNYLIYAGLVLYGLFYHISASEFWPITISRTWFTWENFEFSLLQKPMFGLFLAIFHLFPLNDPYHLYFVKLVFSVIGLCGLILFITFVAEASGKRLTPTYKSLLLLLLLAMSPSLLTNFFRVRADQLTFFVFAFALLFSQRKQYPKSIACWIILPLISIKSLIFYVPAGFILYPEFKVFISGLRPVQQNLLKLLFLAGVIWVVALNVPALSYFKETYSTMDFPNSYLKRFLFSESLILIGSLTVSFYAIYKKEKNLTRYALASLASFVIILLIPQSYPYLVASLAPIIYLPGLLKMFSPAHSGYKRFALSGLQILFVAGSLIYKKESLHRSNLNQIDYISQAARIIDRNNLTYIDGTGILPRQNFIPCFISPHDDVANNSCSEFLRSNVSDIVIATTRLNYLGIDFYKTIESEYTQAIPGFWIKNNYRSLIEKHQTDLTASLPAVFIFGFE